MIRLLILFRFELPLSKLRWNSIQINSQEVIYINRSKQRRLLSLFHAWKRSYPAFRKSKLHFTQTIPNTFLSLNSQNSTFIVSFRIRKNWLKLTEVLGFLLAVHWDGCALFVCYEEMVVQDTWQKDHSLETIYPNLYWHNTWLIFRKNCFAQLFCISHSRVLLLELFCNI